MSDDDPELAVLSHLVGTWDVSAQADGVETASGRQTTQWILGGRYLQTTGFVSTADGSNDFHLMSVVTHDAANGVYRWWSFLSNGHTEESEGTWDADSQTMTRVTRYDGFTQSAKSHFPKPGREEWMIVNTDANGQVVSEMRGTNVRLEE